MTLIQRAYGKSRYFYSFLKSLLFGYLRRKRYEEVESFILFVGYPRSGHTLVAALLDAHPEIVMSIEWGVLSHLRMKYRKQQIYYSIERYSRLFTRRLNNKWTGYSYKVEDMWQGKYKNIRTIGDKLAGKTSLMLKDDPGLIDKLQDEVGCPVKIIHVIRNPFDTITTMARRNFEKSEGEGNMNTTFLAPFIGRYFDRAAQVRKLKESGKYQMMDLYHEDLIKDSRSVLIQLLEFLNVAIPEHYMEKCAEVIYPDPHKSRLGFDWTEELKQEVMENIYQYPFLRDYRFDS
jgi:hypothetical protein